MRDWLEIRRGTAPLIVSFPHTGTDIPAEIEEHLVSPWLARKDADWWVHLLYDMAEKLNATTVRTPLSRTVIDVNRDPSGASLYPGQATTDLCPLTTFDGDSGKVHVELRTRPDQPPSRGVENLSLAVTDEAGVPLDGLTIDVVPWMPAMGHGASVKPQVTALGNGHYTVDNVDFVMPGQWQIRITFSGAIEDHAISVLQIP